MLPASEGNRKAAVMPSPSASATPCATDSADDFSAFLVNTRVLNSSNSGLDAVGDQVDASILLERLEWPTGGCYWLQS